MKIALAQQNYIIGDLKFNSSKIIDAIKKAQKNEICLLIFPELSITGYPPHDNFINDNFINEVELCIKKISAYVVDMAVVLGAIRKDKLNKIYNSAFVIENGEIISIIDKTLLPHYDVFNEKRFFKPAINWEVVHTKKLKLAVTICEDIWYSDSVHEIDVLEKLNLEGNFDFIVNISCSLFDYVKFEKRLSVIKHICSKYNSTLIYCNVVGAQADLIFDGGSLVVNSKCEIVALAKFFEEDFLIFNTDVCQNEKTFFLHKKQNLISEEFSNVDYTQRIFSALILGIKDFFYKTNFKKAILGSSGGIDSAVVQSLLTLALGRDNVTAFLLPSCFSSQHSIYDAKELSLNLKNKFFIVPIEKEYESFISNLKNNVWGETNFSLAEENLQSRIRSTILMTISNKYNSLLVNTSNKSEIAMGYGTLYGDMSGALSVLGDLFKTQVYALAHFINSKHYFIPTNMLLKEPSAELREGQKDSDSLPEYKILDELLFYFINEGKTTKEVKDMNLFDIKLVDDVYTTYMLNEYKRFQFCPILRVSKKSFGRGRIYEIVSNKF